MTSTCFQYTPKVPSISTSVAGEAKINDHITFFFDARITTEQHVWKPEEPRRHVNSLAAQPRRDALQQQDWSPPQSGYSSMARTNSACWHSLPRTCAIKACILSSAEGPLRGSSVRLARAAIHSASRFSSRTSSRTAATMLCLALFAALG